MRTIVKVPVPVFPPIPPNNTADAIASVEDQVYSVSKKPSIIA